ncbi:MAG: GmrSD restriction endonuclease domain-containing protein [Solirubrobacteraceae bacterium]
MTTAVFKKVDYTLDALLSGIEMGTIGLPDIQRPFIWKAVRVRDLFDSMYQGFPVGYLLFWANTMADSTKGIGTDHKQKSPSLLIVDGQQRLTSLYSVLKAKPVLTDDYKEHRIQIAFNPCTEVFEVADAAVRRDPEFIPDISALWNSGEGEFAFVGTYLSNLSKRRALSPDDQKGFAARISRLNELEKYPFTALELAAELPEEKVAEVFVRINSEGVTLKQADFILTLMSVYWEAGRRALEAFCRSAKSPSTAAVSPFNHFIKPSPDQLLRIAVGLAFFRGRLQHVYTLLRGKDMETGEVSEEIRDRQFASLEEAQAKVLDITNWQEFFKALLAAGYASGDVISSETAVLYTYVLFLVGRIHCRVPHGQLRTLIARWFFMATLTGRYTNSPESAIEQDLAKLRGKVTPEEFSKVLEGEIGAALTNDYWEIQLPNALATSAARGPSLFAYYAALRILDAPVLFSTLRVAELLDPAIKANKSALERHHLFPRAYLEKSGVTATPEINQIGNFTLVEWADNIDISDTPPSAYVPKYEQALITASGQTALEEQYRLHALPTGWHLMAYSDFLRERRKLMAATVRRGFSRIGSGGKSAVAPSEPGISDLLKLGESARLEYKSSARWNVRVGGRDDRLEYKILVTLAGFMNADGGTVLVGVDDNGAPVGLDQDYALIHRGDRDGWRSWLTDLVANGLRKSNLSNIRVDFETIDGKDVCRIRVFPAVRPVWVELHTPHEFYARFDNSTRQLTGAEILDYVSQRWGDGAISRVAAGMAETGG